MKFAFKNLKNYFLAIDLNQGGGGDLKLTQRYIKSDTEILLKLIRDFKLKIK